MTLFETSSPIAHSLTQSLIHTVGLQQTDIYFAPSELHGKGVFAARTIAPGEVIEICPVIVFPQSQVEFVRQTVLDNYYFDWGNEGDEYAFALGYGSLYNHSYEPNADYDMDFEGETIDIVCLREIAPGEEITINYNGYPDDRSKVWFEE